MCDAVASSHDETRHDERGLVQPGKQAECPLANSVKQLGGLTEYGLPLDWPPPLVLLLSPASFLTAPRVRSRRLAMAQGVLGESSKRVLVPNVREARSAL